MHQQGHRNNSVCGFIVLAVMLLQPSISLAEPASDQKLNFIIILIDDLGWMDLGCYGSSFYETPNVDTLAAEGMRFTDGYAACPVCSPTRVAVLTGRYPARCNLNDAFMCHRDNPYSPMLPAKRLDDMPLEEVTIAEALKPAGYVTAHIGKWHLGRPPFYPEHQGFDVNIGGTKHGMTWDFFWPGWRNYMPKLIGKQEGEYLPERLSAEAVKFIETNRNKPFFLNMCHYQVHIPIQAKKEVIEKYKAKPRKGRQNDPIYAAMLESVDQSVGRITETLKRLSMEDRTVIFFTSDNGGLATRDGGFKAPTLNAPLRGGKGQLYEGGIRVPWIVKWPGVIKPGSICDVPIISIDIFPTIMEMAGITDVKTRGPIDGESLIPLLTHSGGLKRDAIFWHFPHFSYEITRPSGVIRQGDYKLIERFEDGTLKLFNLKDDISETRNIAFEKPKKTAELLDRLRQWRKEVNAWMPSHNPNFKQAKY